MSRLTLENIQFNLQHILPNVLILSMFKREYGKLGKTEIACECVCKIDGHTWNASYGNLKKGSGCPKCGGNYRPTIKEVKNVVYGINPNVIILDEVYVNSSTKLNCVCLLDNHKWKPTYADLSQGKGCPKCMAKKLSVLKSTPNGNSIRDIRPDLIKYLVNPEDADNYAVSSRSKVEVVCPDCGVKREPISAYTLSSQGFSCPQCSDGISVPEKFVFAILKQLRIDNKRQKTFKWSMSKRYDFWIENLSIILEVNGMQHYSNVSAWNGIDKEIENDKLKYNLAISNGIQPENYIVIDARHSTFEWLKENCIKSLSNHFDLSDIDWDDVWKISQSNIAKLIWETWNNIEKRTTGTMVNLLKLDRKTIIKYLKIGNSIGMCEYIPINGAPKRII